ncbi:sugar phosphate nucleotidyltransferase [Halonotius pteroides]|uniref:Bifunctional protein GlmU n=1 Tax=Halonotius pteroides TaxID=268735 RepID=A0A3A6PXJ1_9EURY|nr:sugar phosphate nucleotidyltransferase [Halonotius pteroides]RJX47974.1 nucleotidyl transferase [Halonotius pteroides]
MSTFSAQADSRPSSAVVLAAGEGIRLRPLTANRPKPMLPAGTRPILEHVLNALIDAGINNIHLVVGYQANRVRSHFGATYRDVPLTYHTQTNQLGSGHALLQAREGSTDSFLLVNGDQIIDSRIVEAVRTTHTDAAAALAVVEGPQAADYGAVTLDGSEITTLSEQPTSGGFRLFNAGVYAFTPEIFETLETISVDRGELPITDALQALIDDKNHTVAGVRTDHFWMDATHAWDLLSLSRALLRRGWVDPPAIDGGDCYVDETAKVHPDATLVGPVVVDSDAVIEAGAVVGPYAAIGASATVGAGAVLRDVVIDTDTSVGPNTTASELVAGQGCAIGGAFTAAGGPADVVLEEQVYPDVDLGGVLSDRVEVGGAATLEPGALVGPDAVLGDGVVVSGQVDAGSEVVR